MISIKTNHDVRIVHYVEGSAKIELKVKEDKRFNYVGLGQEDFQDCYEGLSIKEDL